MLNLKGGENVKWDCGRVTSEKQNKMFHYDPKHSLFYYVRPYLCFPIRTPCPEVGLKFGGKIIFLILINFLITFVIVRIFDDF